MRGIKKNYKIVLGIIIGILISGVVVYASNEILSSNISYDNSSSGLTATNVKSAIDELYDKVNRKPCKVIKGTGTQTSDEIKCGTEEFYVLYTSEGFINVLTKYAIEAGAETISKAPDNSSMINVDSTIENPSYMQNKACGREGFKCGGEGFLSQYKAVLKEIGLPDSIEIKKPSLSELNKAGCSFELSPIYM